LKGHEMKHLTSLSKTPPPAQSVFREFLETKHETLENNTLLKQLF